MIEAMTNGGFKKKGIVFTPSDALEEDLVIFKYIRDYVDKIEILKEKESYTLGNISFSTPVKHIHGVETYGLNIHGKNCSISVITDTEYYENLESHYTGDILIINIVLYDDIYKEKKGIQHLSLTDAEKIISVNKPKVCILTHFGMTMLKMKPWEIAKNLSEKHGVKVIAARDGMQIDIDQFKN
jgi:ribonuclease BN (tRNA processing enzyme)